MVTRRGRSLSGRDWLTGIKYKFTTVTQNATIDRVLKNNASSVKHAFESWIKQIISHELKIDFPDLFQRRRRIKDSELKLEFEQNAKLTQQKGRGILQQAVDSTRIETARSLEKKHIKYADAENDKMLIQSTIEKFEKSKALKWKGYPIINQWYRQS